MHLFVNKFLNVEKCFFVTKKRFRLIIYIAREIEYVHSRFREAV